MERQGQKNDEVGNRDSLRHVPGSSCPDAPGQVGVDGPTLHYTFDIRVPEPDTAPDERRPRLSPPFGPGSPPTSSASSPSPTRSTPRSKAWMSYG